MLGVSFKNPKEELNLEYKDVIYVLHDWKFKYEQQKPQFLETDLFQDLQAQLWVSELAHLGFSTHSPGLLGFFFFFLEKFHLLNFLFVLNEIFYNK